MGTNVFSSPLRGAFFAALTVAAALMLWQATIIWIGEDRLDSQKPQEIAKGATLLPGDADAWDRLGRFYLLSFSDPDIPQAISDFQRAVKIDPHSQDYWMDLASAYDAAGNDAAARNAYQEARRAYPSSALVDWNYGNFLLRNGDDTGAYAAIERAVRGDPSLLPLAVSRVWHSTQNANELLDHVIPPDADSYLTAMNYFASIHQVKAGVEIWKRLIGLHQPVRLADTFEFFQEMIRENDGDDALLMWVQAVAASGKPQLAPEGDSVVSDGAFEAEFPNGGLGWRWQPQDGASIDFDGSTPNEKGRSVRLDFSGGVNTDLTEPTQYVVVQPSTTYHFNAEMRTDEITTDSGIYFYIFDAAQGDLNARTASLTGTRSWTNVTFDIAASPNTHFFCIRLSRAPSRFFDNKLEGTVWITDVSLVPVATPARAPHP